MHYFKMNIGDYAKKAGRLSMLEHGAYTLLIHSCYDREQFPTLDDAFDWCWARDDDEKRAVEFVLGKFFVIEDGVYVQRRIKEELDKYHENAATNKRIAVEREEKRTNRARSVNEPPPNQEPRTKNQETINQEPKNHKPVIKEKQKKEIPVEELMPGVSEQVKKDFIAHRKIKKAAITKTVIEGIKREADKADISLEAALIECCTRGWVGFKAEWYQNSNKRQARASPDDFEAQKAFNDQQTAIAYKKLFGDKPETTENEIDITP